jgi:hypothetical protein
MIKEFIDRILKQIKFKKINQEILDVKNEVNSILQKEFEGDNFDIYAI